MFSVSYVANVTEGAAVVYWKPVLAVLRSGDGYSEGQNMKKEQKRHMQEFDRTKLNTARGATRIPYEVRLVGLKMRFNGALM